MDIADKAFVQSHLGPLAHQARDFDFVPRFHRREHCSLRLGTHADLGSLLNIETFENVSVCDIALEWSVEFNRDPAGRRARRRVGCHCRCGARIEHGDDRRAVVRLGVRGRRGREWCAQAAGRGSNKAESEPES